MHTHLPCKSRTRHGHCLRRLTMVSSSSCHASINSHTPSLRIQWHGWMGWMERAQSNPMHRDAIVLNAICCVQVSSGIVFEKEGWGIAIHTHTHAHAHCARWCGGLVEIEMAIDVNPNSVRRASYHTEAYSRRQTGTALDTALGAPHRHFI